MSTRPKNVCPCTEKCNIVGSAGHLKTTMVRGKPKRSLYQAKQNYNSKTEI